MHTQTPPVISLGWVRIAAPLGASLTRAVLPQGSLSDSCVPARPFPGCSWEFLGCLFTPAHWVAGPFGSKPCLQQGLQLSSPYCGAASSLQPFPRSAKQGSTLPGRAGFPARCQASSLALVQTTKSECTTSNHFAVLAPASPAPCSAVAAAMPSGRQEGSSLWGRLSSSSPERRGLRSRQQTRGHQHTAAREIPAGHKDKHLHCLS